jgi:hypothetical protein
MYTAGLIATGRVALGIFDVLDEANASGRALGAARFRAERTVFVERRAPLLQYAAIAALLMAAASYGDAGAGARAAACWLAGLGGALYCADALSAARVHAKIVRERGADRPEIGVFHSARSAGPDARSARPDAGASGDVDKLK